MRLVLRKIKYASRIQKWIRGFLARKRYKILKRKLNAAILIQRMYRKHLIKKYGENYRLKLEGNMKAIMSEIADA